MTHAHEVIDQAAVVRDALGAAAIGDARCLYDGGIVAHVVDHPDEALIEHRQRLVQKILERRDRSAPGRNGLLGAQSFDLCLLGAIQE
jgi:hypothetical protein